MPAFFTSFEQQLVNTGVPQIKWKGILKQILRGKALYTYQQTFLPCQRETYESAKKGLTEGMNPEANIRFDKMADLRWRREKSVKKFDGGGS